MNSKYGGASDPHRLLINFSDNIKLKRSDKYVALSNLCIYYAWKIIKKSQKNNKFELSAPRCNEEFQLPVGWFSVSDIQGHFEYTFKKTWRKSDNPLMRKYLNKIESRVTVRISARYYLEILTPETMKLFGSSKSKRDISPKNFIRLKTFDLEFS